MLPALLVLALHAADPEWTVDHSFRIRRVGEVTPSPDGKLVAWTESWAVMEGEKSEWRSHVFASNADGSARRQLTQGEKSASAIRFSQDGAWLYFVSDRAGKKNVYRMPLAGGEAQQLTDWKGTMGGYAVAPDNARIAFAGAEEDAALDKRKKEKNDYRVVQDTPRNHSLWIVATSADKPDKPQRLVKADYHIGGFDWSPDSRWIAFEHRPRPDADTARHADLAEVNIATGEFHERLHGEASESDPHYSPDGRFLAFLHHPGGRVDGTRIHLYDRQSGASRPLAATYDQQPQIVDWAPDSKALVFTEAKGTRNVIHRIAVDGPAAELYVPERGTLAGVNMSGNPSRLGFTFESGDQPGEAYVLTPGRAPARVSAANTNLSLPPAPRMEEIRWKAQDGLEISGLLVHPLKRDPDARVPLVLLIHGGPSGVWQRQFTGSAGRYPVAAFAQLGFAVLMPNPRGSSAYGLEFRQKVVRDWGGRDFRDLMSGVDHVIGMGLADPERMAVMGWSYGGYMTAWTVTQTNRFKAAAMGAAITNHVSMYGTQDIPSTYEDYFGGPPWEHAGVYERSSPMNFVHRANTPMLILHGEADDRVPITQGYEFRRALERRGVPVRMVTYPRQGHTVTEPKLQKNVMEEHLAWAKQHLDGVTETHVMVPMRDGARLSTYLYTPSGSGPWPVLYEQRYASLRGDAARKRYAKIASAGYVVAAQNFRGTHLSEGTYMGYRALGFGELRDGYDTVEWLARQKWSTGKIGTFGGSQAGYAQNFLAVTQPPHLVAQYIIDGGLSLFHLGYRRGGVTRIERFKQSMMLDARDPAEGRRHLEDQIAHPNYDDYWKLEDCYPHFGKMNVPAFIIASWFDFMSRGSIDSYIGRQHQGGPGARGSQRLLIGPWLHGGQKNNPKVAELEFPRNAGFDMDAHLIRWFDFHLKGKQNGIDTAPPVWYYTTGENLWHKAKDWPIEARATDYYLQPGGGLARSQPGGASYTDFQSDPRHPAPVAGRAEPTARDARGFESHPDVRTFTSPALTSPVEWTGDVRAEIYLSSSAPDTDILVRVNDVQPDGRSILLVDSIQRAKYRDSFEKPSLMKAGEVYKLTWNAGWLSHRFQPGHRIRITISGSAADYFEPNPNTGEEPAFEGPKKFAVARSRIHHATGRASKVIAPVR